jgi:hypothetical protein
LTFQIKNIIFVQAMVTDSGLVVRSSLLQAKEKQIHYPESVPDETAFKLMVSLLKFEL